MTVRFKDQGQLADRDEAEAARLLAVLSPREPDPVMESRVYARVMAQPARTAQRRWVVACVGLLLVSTTILAAALVHRWLARPRSATIGSPVSATEQPAPQRPDDKPPTVPSDQLVQPSSARGIGASPPAVAPPGAPAVPSHPVHAGTIKRRPAGASNVEPRPDEAAPPDTHEPWAQSSSSEARMAAAPSEEAALVLAALRALRRGHDPVKAGALLDQYLTRFSHGALVEEALALGMEAALDRSDAATAKRLADRYMERYPAGRFAGLARRAAGREGP